MATRDRFLKEFPKALADDASAIFIGAGVSVGAGYPSWKGLLKEIGEELGVDTNDTLDLAALAQWSIHKTSGRTRVQQVIRNEIGPDHEIPAPLEIIARLPSRNIWTTNYDRLIERAFEAIRRPLGVVSIDKDLSVRSRPGAARLYKMHGSIDRLDDIVISTEDFELYKRNRGAFLPLLQSHMTSFSVLFIGLSFADPNIRHVLSLIRETFHTSPPEHFALVRPPQEEEYKSKDEHEARLTQHRLWAEDLKRYGLQVVEIDNYGEVPKLLQDVERRVASGRVWVSGSWPQSDSKATQLAELSEAVGKVVGELNLSLVCGSGQTVGSAAITGFLDALRKSGSWDLERRLLVRPFSQPVSGGTPNELEWAELRKEMARISGVVIFIGGVKFDKGSYVDAAGVLAEKDAAERANVFLLPIGAFGGVAGKIANSLIGSSLPTNGFNARRPTDEEIRGLQRPASTADLARGVENVLRRFLAGKKV